MSKTDNSELLARIDVALDKDPILRMVSDQFLHDCRDEIQRLEAMREYVPMTDDERRKWWASDYSNSVMLEKFEVEVIKRYQAQIKGTSNVA